MTLTAGIGNTISIGAELEVRSVTILCNNQWMKGINKLVMENQESHGISIFENPGLENLENQFWSWKVMENLKIP